MMFAGDETELRRTENTQPCLYLADLGAAIAMKEAGVLPAAAAGFSLGEIPALAFAGAYSYMDGFSMGVCRGAFMGKAAAAVSASMAAIVKLPYETVEELCTHYRQVYPVNYNGGGQLVVSGASAELEPFCREVKAAGRAARFRLRSAAVFIRRLWTRRQSRLRGARCVYPCKARAFDLC